MLETIFGSRWKIVKDNSNPFMLPKAHEKIGQFLLNDVPLSGGSMGVPLISIVVKVGQLTHRRVLHLPPASPLGHCCVPSAPFSRYQTFLPSYNPSLSPMRTFFPTDHLLSVKVCLDTSLSISTSSSPHDRAITYSCPFKYCGFTSSSAGFLELQRG